MKVWFTNSDEEIINWIYFSFLFNKKENAKLFFCWTHKNKSIKAEILLADMV
jgi:hypothetical protein